MEERILTNSLARQSLRAVPERPTLRHWYVAVCMGLSLLLGACATAPSNTSGLPAAQAAAPTPAAPTSPSGSAADKVTPSSAENTVTLKPQGQLGLTPPTDVWERIRRGFAMPDLENDLVRNREQWYASRPDHGETIRQRTL